MKITESWRVMTCLTLAAVAVASGAGGVAHAAQRITASGPQPAGTVPVSLCKSIGQVDHLVVRRADEFPPNGIRFSFPAVSVVTEVASVQDVAKVVCALPRIPIGFMSCAIDLGIRYRLGFTAPDETFPAVVVSATGCETVRGIGPIRWVGTSPEFWHRLGTAMGLPNPTWTTFRGTGVSSAEASPGLPLPVGCGLMRDVPRLSLGSKPPMRAG